MKVQLWVEKVKQREPEIILLGSELVNLENRNFPEYKKQIKEELEQKKKENDMNNQFSLMNEVYKVMRTPELERDDEGKIQKASDGQLQNKSFDIIIQRIRNRILDPIEKLLDKYGILSKDHKTSTIELKPSDAIYLAQRMQIHFDEYNIIAPFVIKGYEYFVDLEAEAKKLLEKG